MMRHCHSLSYSFPVFQNEGEPDFKNWPLIREAQMRVYQTIKIPELLLFLKTENMEIFIRHAKSR